jgi:hypothetical protein
MRQDEIRIGNVNVKCFCCGRMIPGEPFVKQIGKEDRLFCREDCYEFFLKYEEIKRSGN